ncbi:hypothetical protein COL23_11470 [Priestia aryabhattai]|uniref:hypothetical protein n=1 Tax=Priestia aryabhattai TaxID=412384 RepID=UPI000BF6A733|nr:hypothetical protein [Priestia aryabhattai]PFW76581.1 hypothetical protein COL23_11470 [Priestia aryabhattai]
MGRYYYLKGNGWGCGVWFVLFLLFITAPIWIYLLTFPLRFLVFLGEIGEAIFGEGNGAIMLIIAGLLFAGMLVLIAKFLEKIESRNKEEE